MGYRYHDKEAGIDTTIIRSMKDIIKDYKKIEFKKGHTLAELIPNKYKSAVYNWVMYYILELMLMDVANGDIVFLDKKRKSRLYVVFKDATPNMLAGKGYDEKKSKIPKIDFKVTGYKVPFFAFDPGYEDAHPALLHVPAYLYSILIEQANTGIKYPKPALKKFWFED